MSEDFFGDQLRASLKASHVDYSYSPKSSRYTMAAFVKLEGGQARYSFIEEGSACRMLTEEQLPKLDDSVAALHLGSISILFEPCATTLGHLCAREHGSRVISFDPNIRAGLVKDKPAHLKRIAHFATMADIVKLSDEDLAWIGGDVSPEALASNWLAAGAKVVIVTRGGKGAIAFTKKSKAEVAASAIKVADTVGAGDTFTAGILTYFHRNKLLRKDAIAALPQDHLQGAIDLAARAAAVTVSRPGADPPWAHELA